MADAEYKRERTKWLKAHGICVSCGNADAEPERVRCRACLDKNAAAALGVTLEEVAQHNVDKLRQRYPEGFSTDRSLHREG